MSPYTGQNHQELHPSLRPPASRLRRFLHEAGPQALKWTLAMGVLIGPPIYLAYKPDDFTPLVDTLFSIFLFLLALWIGNSAEASEATRRANEKWLPQAESVIFRLITLHANVRRLCLSTRTNCDRSSCDMPELAKDSMRAVRIKLKTDCEASAQRLDDVGYQLEDAIEDWRRFIVANCYGSECERIFDAIQQRRDKLSEFEYDIEERQHRFNEANYSMPMPSSADSTLGNTTGEPE